MIMATGEIYSAREFLFRLQTMVIDGGTDVLRNIFDQQLQNVPLSVFLAIEKTSVNRLRGQKTITQNQYSLLYPTVGQLPNSANFDITLIICLLRNLRSFGLNQRYSWHIQPQPTDTSLEADLCRLRGFRNEIAHVSSTTGFNPASFLVKWTDIEQVLLRLNNAAPNPLCDFKQILESYKHSSLEPGTEKRIQAVIENWRKLENDLEVEMGLMKEDFKDVSRDVKEVKDNFEKLKNQLTATNAVKEGLKHRKKAGIFQRIVRNILPSRRKKEDMEHFDTDSIPLVTGTKQETAQPIEQKPSPSTVSSENIYERIQTSTALQHSADGGDDKQKQMLRDVGNGEIERNKRLYNLFVTEKDVQGRLQLLDEQNIADLEDSCESTHIVGGFGDIYVSSKIIPGLNMKIVIKKIQIEGDEEKMMSITNEKLASRTMHFGIVPLLALREDTIKKTYYFISPHFENGDLFEAIQADNENLRQGKDVILNRGMRLRILYHIASAIDFLHTPVKGFRETILHMDIKTLNIVLDKYYNARLIDFGLAREMKEGKQAKFTTTRQLSHTQGYYRTMKNGEFTKHIDYYNFGVVIRELLTGLLFFIEGQKKDDQLRNKTDLDIRRHIMELWMNDRKPAQVAEQLNQLSLQCIKDYELESVDSHSILSKIKTMMNNDGVTQWTKRKIMKGEQQKPKCEMCLQSSAVMENILAHDATCTSKLNVCVACMRNAYLNPIRCYSCNVELKPIIGHGWGALLIAGNDPDKNIAESFKDDVAAIETVITSKWPLVMGISEKMVKTICPTNPGVDEELKDRLKNAVSSLNTNEEIQTILIYYSGHYYPKEVEGGHGRGFKLGGESEYLTKCELQAMLVPFLKQPKGSSNTVLTQRRFIVFLDCCYAPSFLSTPTNRKHILEGEQRASALSTSGLSGYSNAYQCRKDSSTYIPHISFEDSDECSIVQINACRPYETAVLTSTGSVLRQFLVQALSRKALNKQCHINSAIENPKMDQDVEHCNDCGLSGDFVTMQDLADYITKHLEKCHLTSSKPVINAQQVTSHDAKLGYVVNFSADLLFTCFYNETKKYVNVAQEMFSGMTPLKRVIFKAFFDEMVKADKITHPVPTQPDFIDIMCIEIERGPKKQHWEELDTLEKVTGAWNSKRELVVSLRDISEIRRGKVGVFLTEGCSFNSFLEKSSHAKKSNEQDGIVFSLELESLRLFYRTIVNLKNKQLERHLIDLISAVEKAKQLHGINVKELLIILPVKSDGKTLLRDDFVCFQLIKE